MLTMVRPSLSPRGMAPYGAKVAFEQRTRPIGEGDFQGLASPCRSASRYSVFMSLPRCKAIILYGRDAKGNRGGLVVPRTCSRVATRGDYCGVHARQAELQALYRDLLGYGWETKVRLFEDRKRREREREGTKVARGMAEAARACGMDRLASFLAANQFEVARVWGEAAPH